MNISKRKESFAVRRIEKLENGWKFYPADSSKKPIFIDFQKFSGQLQRRFKFFWQKRQFEYEHYNEFIVSASLDGILLFEIPEDKYPETLKKDLAAFKKMQADYLEKCKKEDKELQKDLAEYWKLMPADKNLEDEISKLRIPLRVYLKLHLFRSSEKNIQKRVYLVLQLCQMAERIYKRHVKETDKEQSLDLSCSFATFRFCPIFHEDIWPDYRFDMADMEKSAGIEETHKVYASYYEAETLIKDILPATNNTLIKRYLNYLVRKLLGLFAEDWDTFQSNMKRNGWYNLRSCTDEQDYAYQYKRMKLLHHTNFILPEEFSQSQIDDFINNYSLN